jgi:hypothetical protein
MQLCSSSWSRSKIWFAAIVIVAVAGCGETRTAHFSPRNYRLLQALRTAVSARKSDWLEQTAKLIEHRHETRELADEEFAALGLVVAQARRGEWTKAESDLMKLIKAQRATAEEIEEMKATHRRARKQVQPEE